LYKRLILIYTYLRWVIVSSILQITKPTPQSREFRFRNSGTWSKNGWKEGQFLTLKVHFHDKEILRNFSIVRADEFGISICIKLVKDGEMSKWAEQAKEGESVEISLAVGEFLLPNPIPKKLFFVAAGSGITPIYAMLNGLSKKQLTSTEIELIYANRNQEEAIYLEEITRLIDKLRGKITLYFEENPENHNGKIGRLTAETSSQLVSHLDREEHVYICGPEIVRNNFIEALQEKKIPSSQIHTESFVIEKGISKEGNIEFLESDSEYLIATTENESILDALIREKAKIDFQCKIGACESCVLFLEKGELINAQGETITQGSTFLSCQSFHAGKGDIVISKKNKPRSRNFWLAAASLLGVILISGFTFLNNGQFKMKGTYNTGHENLKCEDCHFEAEGNLRQQVQHNVKTFLKVHEHKTYIDVGHKRVDNTACLSCHQRPNDRHPVSRFKEIRFAEQRKELGIHECRACHSEHTGTSMSILPSNYCQSCHENTEVKDDPLDIKHQDLFRDGKWNTCLQCHDFHGNHIYKVPQYMKDTIPLLDVQNYLKGEKVIYSTRKHHKALK